MMEKNINILKQKILEGQEHKRIKTKLTQYANSIGYTKKVTFKNGMEPDVLFLNVDDDNLFMGDAKDSANETVSNKDTTSRIAEYVKEFSAKLNARKICGGIIAIATNDKDAALDWKEWLNETCEECNLRNPDFEIEYTADDTFIVLWLIN
jgi:hypothetical protein